MQTYTFTQQDWKKESTVKESSPQDILMTYKMPRPMSMMVRPKNLRRCSGNSCMVAKALLMPAGKRKYGMPSMINAKPKAVIKYFIDSFSMPFLNRDP